MAGFRMEAMEEGVGAEKLDLVLREQNFCLFIAAVAPGSRLDAQHTLSTHWTVSERANTNCNYICSFKKCAGSRCAGAWP